MYESLGAMLNALDRLGELHRVSDVVSPILEVAAIADLHARQPAASVSNNARRFDPDHCAQGGKALLFENVEGCDFPLAINIFGSYRRMEMALGCADSGGFEAIGDCIAALVKLQPPRGIGEALTKARQLLPLLRTPPKLKRSGPCQQIIKLAERGEVDLTRVPLIKCWPLDGDPRAVGYDFSPEQSGTAAGQGRYITFAGMHTIHADDRNAERPASHNIGMYRAQLINETHLAMHWHVHHDGAAHWRSWKKLGEPMPIAICLGGESVLPYAATAPLPPGLGELLMAGFLNGRGIPLVRCKTVPLRVPANAEIVIEGWVSTECGEIGWAPSPPSPSGRGAGGEGAFSESRGHSPSPNPLPEGEGFHASSSPGGERASDLGRGAVFEGPFGDHTGFYSMPDRYPIVNVTAVTHRRDAVYPTTIVGLPPQEDYYLGKATERIFLPLLQTLIPDIVDYHLPMFGCFHNCAFVAIEKAYPLQARRVMHAIWGAGQMAWTKMIVIVEASDVNVHDEQQVMRAIADNCHLRRDIELVNGPLDILDHAAPRLGAGGKIGFDATRAWPGEEVNGVAVRADDSDGDDRDRTLDAEQIATSARALDSVTAASCPAFADGRWLFVAAERSPGGEIEGLIERIWTSPHLQPVCMLIVVNHTVNVDDWQEVMFHLCANSDPSRDLHRSDPKLGRIAFNSTSKLPGDERNSQPVRPFPPIIEMDADVICRIRTNAQAFGL